MSHTNEMDVTIYFYIKSQILGEYLHCKQHHQWFSEWIINILIL